MWNDVRDTCAIVFYFIISRQRKKQFNLISIKKINNLLIFTREFNIILFVRYYRQIRAIYPNTCIIEYRVRIAVTGVYN